MGGEGGFVNEVGGSINRDSEEVAVWQFCRPLLPPRQTTRGWKHHGMEYELIEIVNPN